MEENIPNTTAATENRGWSSLKAETATTSCKKAAIPWLYSQIRHMLYLYVYAVRISLRRIVFCILCILWTCSYHNNIRYTICNIQYVYKHNSTYIVYTVILHIIHCEWPPHSNGHHQDYEPFLVEDSELNLYLPQASWEGATPKLHPQKLTAGTWKWWFPASESPRFQGAPIFRCPRRRLLCQRHLHHLCGDFGCWRCSEMCQKGIGYTCPINQYIYVYAIIYMYILAI